MEEVPYDKISIHQENCGRHELIKMKDCELNKEKHGQNYHSRLQLFCYENYITLIMTCQKTCDIDLRSNQIITDIPCEGLGIE